MGQFSNILASFVYNALIKTAKLSDKGFFSKIWQPIWNKSNEFFSGPVKATVHGQKVVLNFGYTYPINARKFPNLNNPLVELTYQCYSAQNKPITLIDIGAAVGDTVLLLYSNCPGMIKDFYCIDGDPEFFFYLQNNLSHLKEGKLINALLSSSEEHEKELVRIHKGTASAQGEKIIQSATLDSIIQKSTPERIDMLKTDVDGFDGKVLIGSKTVLQKYHPAVIFEWHPILCRQTDNNWTDHFTALLECDYNKFIWFTKYGTFSHFMEGFDKKSTDMLAELCINNRMHPDWHYDVISLHRDSEISPIALSELLFARNKKSFY